MRRVTPLIDRILARVDADASCWVWTGALSEGYGVVGRGRRTEGTIQTHRAVWELLVGPIPPGHDLDHLCRNRRCCNPDHLEPVTRAENVARGARRKGYGPRERSHCLHGHAWTAENTIHSPKQRHCRACNRDRRKKVAA